MELEVYKKSDFYEDYISSQKEYYERTNADAYFAERLAEKDKEIALLKERICNGDVSRLTWIDDCIAKDKEIAKLKAQSEMREKEIEFMHSNCKWHAGGCSRLHGELIAATSEIAELKAKLQNQCVSCPVKMQEDDVVAEKDKEIAEKDNVISELKDKLQNVSELLTETREWLIESQKMHKRCADGAIKKIRHQKFKRCLAMAEWCDAEADVADADGDYEDMRWFQKWHKRWLELAKKFKEAK